MKKFINDLIAAGFQRMTQVEEEDGREACLVAQSDTGPTVFAFDDPEGELFVSSAFDYETMQLVASAEESSEWKVVSDQYAQCHVIRARQVAASSFE